MTPLALLLVLGAAPQQASTPFPLAERLPADTLVYLAIPDAERYREQWAAGPWGRLAAEPAVRAFLRDAPQRTAKRRDVASPVFFGLPPWVEDWKSAEFGMVGPLLPGADAEAEPLVVLVREVLTDEQAAERRRAAVVGSIRQMIGSPAAGDADASGPTVLTGWFGLQPLAVRVERDGVVVSVTATLGSADVEPEVLDLPPPTTPLTAAPTFAWARRAFEESGASVLFHYGLGAALDARYARTQDAPAPAPLRAAQRAWAERFAPLGGYAAVAGWDADGLGFQRSLLGLDEPWPAGFASGPLDRDLLRFVPAAAESFGVSDGPLGSWAAAVLQPLAELLAVGSPDLRARLLGERSSETYAALRSLNGPRFWYGSFRVFGSDLLLFARTRSPKLLAETLQGILLPVGRLLAQEGAPVRLRAARADAGDVVVYSLAFLGEAQDLAMVLGRPALAVSPAGWLVVGTDPAQVKAAAAAGPRPQEPSALDRPEVRAFLEQVPDDASLLAWRDFREVLRFALPLLALQSSALAETFGLDFGPPPPAGALVSAFPPSRSWVVRRPEGSYGEKHGGFVVGDFLTLLHLFAAGNDPGAPDVEEDEDLPF